MILMGKQLYIILWSDSMADVNVFLKKLDACQRYLLLKLSNCTSARLEVPIVDTFKVYECPYMSKLNFLFARNGLMSSPWVITLFLVS